jgi:peptidoglycan/LPS O-acetylase OafA/YrhL
MKQHITSSSSNEDHLPWLDGLRGLAALWVLISHVQILSGMKYVPVLSWGGLAVDLFMILSGFLMAHHYLVLPAIMLAIARIGPVKTTLLFIAACIALKALFPAFFHQFEMPSFLPMKLSVFFGGIWIALARSHTSMRPGLFIAVALAIVWVTIERSPGAVAQVFLIAPPPGKSRHLACILCEFERAIRPPAA